MIPRRNSPQIVLRQSGESRPEAMEHARAYEPVQDGRVYIEKINGPFLYQDKGTPAEYGAGLTPWRRSGWRST